MKGISVTIFIKFLLLELGCSQFLNHRPFPTYSLENMPETGFSCRDKILGGYYADSETQCQMFHICVKVAGVGIQDFRFLCPNGTAFDQDHQICAEWEDVDCDATTLYYSSDNFDLYRIGSGFESKAYKYGEEEETFALQRAETGDSRLSREHQIQKVNQKKPENLNVNTNKKSRPQNNDRDIFRGSSSSNYFNNRNGGKETDEDYDDDNVNNNQNRDDQKQKFIKKQQKRPVQRQPQQQQTQPPKQTQATKQTYPPQQTQQPKQFSESQPIQATTSRTSKPYTNNFAGSSYIPTTTRPTTTTLTTEQYTTAINNYRLRQKQRPNYEKQYNNAETFRQNTHSSPSFTVSTPAPFKQTSQNRQTTPYDDGQYRPTTQSTQKSATENYPPNFPQNPVKPATKKINENYPSTHFDVPKTNPSTSSPKYTQPLKTELKKTTLKQADSQSTKKLQNQNIYPSTFSPRTNAAYSQISQFTSNYQKQSTQQQQQQKPKQQQPSEKSTQKTTQATQYTPTVPKIITTTPSVTRNYRFDETQYDDGTYNEKYDRKDDEFLKGAHSQNIASSKNELNTKARQEIPRPFSTTSNTPKSVTTSIYKSGAQTTPQQSSQPYPKITTKAKKVKDYDYAYYDTNGSEADYQIDTEIKKSTAKNQ